MDASVQTSKNAVAKRWTPALAQGFCPVSSYFLAHYHRLTPHPGARGLNSSEAMLVVQLMDFKWDAQSPFPSLRTLAKRMGLTTRSVRATLARLEELGYIKRVPRPNGGSNRLDTTGLFEALEKLMAEDAASRDEAA